LRGLHQSSVENSKQKIPAVQQISERELAMENWVEEDLIVI
jgi:hypothetical protein